MRTKIKAILVILAMMVGALSGTVHAEILPPNPEGHTVPAIAAGDTMNTNSGIVTAVYGTLDLNKGEVKMIMPGGVVTANWNDALIGVNKGYLDGNKGTVDENNSTLDFNEGTVNENREKGIINENYKTVDENWGYIKTNYYNGYIEKNTSIGKIEKNTGKVNYNDGIIEENAQSGRVNYNQSGGKIWKNIQNVYYNRGYIYNNAYPGSVTNNSGTVYNYSGTVSTNTGTVYQLVRESSMPPEIKSINYVSGFYLYGEDRFFKQGGSGKIKITVSDDYSISRCYMTDGLVIKTADGEYSISNVKKPATLFIETEKKNTGTTSSGSIFPAGMITPEASADLPSVENAILNLPNDKEPAWTSFSILKAKGVPKSKRAIRLSWKPVPGATGYIIYGNRCGSKNKYKKITPVNGTRWIQKKLKKGTYYKYLIVAVKGDKVLAVSKTIHVATNGGKVGNNTKVTLNKRKKNLKAGKTFKLKAILKKGSLKVKNHRKVAYESSDPSKATVSQKGKVKAVGKGTCYIYAYAQNGVFARCKITVK